MLEKEGKDPAVPSSSSGFNASCRTVQTHSACHEADKRKGEYSGGTSLQVRS